MLGDVLEAAPLRRPTCGSSPTTPRPLVAADLGVEVVADPGGGQGAAVRRRSPASTGTASSSTPTCPCVDRPTALAALRRAAAPCPRRRRDGTTNALALPVRRGVPAALRARQRRPLRAAQALGSSPRSRAAELRRRRRHDSSDLERLGRAPGRARGRAQPLRRAREGRPALRRRRRREARRRAPRRARAGRADGDRQRRRRPRGARAPRLARPRLRPLRASRG